MWYTIKEQQVELRIFVKPNAKKTALIAVSDQGLHIKLHARPHENEANDELIDYLSQILQIPKSQIILQRGGKSRYKSLMVPMNTKMQQLLSDPARFFDNH